MSLNIKNEESRRRVRELARLAGETMAEAVDRAVIERLDRIRKKRNKDQLVQRLLEIGLECAKLPVLDKRSPAEMLYDRRGLPKSPRRVTGRSGAGKGGIANDLPGRNH